MTVVVDNGLALNSEIALKLAGIQEGATANSTDAALRDRATHTGVQAINTVTGLQTDLNARLLTTDAPATVRGTSLTGLVTTNATAVTAVDTVLTAAGKTQRQITDNSALLPPFFDTAWYKSGMYYDSGYPFYTSATPTTRSVGTVFFNKRKVLDNATFNEIAINVTSAANGGQVFYGVYSSDANGRPALLLASGSASTDTTGVKSTAVTLALTKGQVVWDAFLNTAVSAPITSFTPIFCDGSATVTSGGNVSFTKAAQTSLVSDARDGAALVAITTTRVVLVALRAA